MSVHRHLELYVVICTAQPIIMAPIQVVELTGMLPELESSPHSRNTSANTGTLSASRKKVQKPKGIMSYYGYQRVGSKGTANWPWMVSYMSCEICRVTCCVERTHEVNW